MRISELSRTCGVPVATVKYYLREGLLHEGRRTAATQAQYDETHVARLRLVRALVGVGGLSLAATHSLLEHLDHPQTSTHDLLGVAHRQVEETENDDVDTTEAAELLDQLGWHIPTNAAAIRRLAAALEGLRAANFTLPPGRLHDYAETMHALAEREVGDVPTESEADAIRHVILGTVLVEPLLLALRRLAQIDASARRFTPQS